MMKVIDKSGSGSVSALGARSIYRRLLTLQVSFADFEAAICEEN